MQFVSEKFFQLLELLYATTGNLGIAIILLTLIIRAAMLPLTLPGQKKQIENRDKMKKLKPKLDAIKKKYKDDKVKLSQAQVDLFKEHDIQLFSLSTLLPFVQIFFLIALYQVLINYLGNGAGIDATFLGFHLVEKDSTYILPVIAAALQLVLSVMILPGIEKHDVVSNTSKKKAVKELNDKEQDQQEMAESIQQQMVFILPIMTGFFASQFPAGVALYWIASTVFSLVQQYFISGLGGLEKYLRFLPMISRK